MSESASRGVFRRHRGLLLVVLCWVLFVALPSSATVRCVLAYPLYVHEENAQGDVAYVMADGYAFWNRLSAASDLYHEHRVPKIYILNDQEGVGYDFVGKQSETRAQRAVRYLQWLGVPESAIALIDVDGEAVLGSLSEARAFADLKLPNLRRVVVVTSAPHTRRSKLCFQRSLPTEIDVQSYAASELATSAELYEPIWIEYVKLVIYYFVA